MPHTIATGGGLPISLLAYFVKRWQGASTCDYIEGWKWKMTTLLRSKEKQELVSRDKKDRLDFEQIAALASKMGLYSHLYVKVVVISKVPLPNYRFDLDERRPQREVILPLGLQKRVDSYLGDYLSQKSRNMDSFQDNGFSRSNSSCSVATDEGLFEQPEPLPQSKAAMEKVIWRRSMQLRSQQQAWQESPEGRKMLEFRRSLPAYKEKNALLMAILNNQVVIISGETGCGKTTQIPQFILESEIESVRGVLCSIICTQPRRISAMSVSERVAVERGEKLGETVGYKVRLEGMKGRDTHLLFCTTGILLRRLLADRNLKGVTYVIVDEIHERGMNEDFLLIVLKDLLPRRPELRLILMSATLDAELFSSYFGGAPMVHIPGFTYPVHTHFLENVLEMTGYQLTPYNQIDDYGQEKTWKMNKQAPRKRKSQLASAVEDALRAADFKNFGPETRESLSCWNPDSIGFNLIEYLLCNICEKETPGAVLVFMTGWDDISSLKDKLQAHPMLGDTSRVLLLACHGSMASAEQYILFALLCPLGIHILTWETKKRKEGLLSWCEGVVEWRYGRFTVAKEWQSIYKGHDSGGKMTRKRKKTMFVLIRTQKLIFDEPEDGVRKIVLATNIAETSITINDVVFVIDCGKAKESSYDALNNTPCLLPSWISKVSAQQVQNAIEYLKVIGALDEDENLTVLGRYLTMLPMEPKLGKMLILGAIFNCLDPVLTVVAGLSVRDPFLTPMDKKDAGGVLEDSVRTVFISETSVWRLTSSNIRHKNFILGMEASTLSNWALLFLLFVMVAEDCYYGLIHIYFTGLPLAEAAKAQFSQDYSDHLALVRAYEGWKDAERDLAGYEYCWKNFLSAQSMKAIDALRREFYSLLRDAGLVDSTTTTCDSWSYDVHLLRAVICYGLYPGICSVVHNEKSFSLKTMEDGQVLLYSNSVNARDSKIPYPWLVFNEKIKVNSVFLRDSTAVSDSVLLLFGGSILRGDTDGHLKMLGGYLEFFMKPATAEMYQSLRKELEELIQTKLLNPRMVLSHHELLSAVRLLISEDQCDGRFVFNRQVLQQPSVTAIAMRPAVVSRIESGPGGDNSKSQLQTLLTRAGYAAPTYKTKQLNNNQFRATVEFKGMQIMGRPCNNKKQAEKDAAAEALECLMGGTHRGHDYVENMSMMLKKSKKDHNG
ncbi:hypothetical protein RHSIM_Rhsim09G0102100 [Rhododendron simsii]|uniref:RNA helicase n=1 Tax=Rhododendron simsii TaxID=118357 RepID=A0A834GCT8_RHOSS|nr:hypothetical protein RHSIM_Rhsim09G0102100 [Rhododendron simsii]